MDKYHASLYTKVMRTIQRLIVSALIFSKDKRLLLCKRGSQANLTYPDLWHIPGGGKEEHETELQALHREIFEEVGIDISRCDISLADDQGSGTTKKTLEDGEIVNCQMTFQVYSVTLQGNYKEIKVRLGAEFSSYQWFLPANIPVEELVPAGPPLFKRLGMI